MRKLIFIILAVLIITGIDAHGYKNYIRFLEIIKIKEYHKDGVIKEIYYYENGNKKTSIWYRKDGTISSRDTFYKNGKAKTSIGYHKDGITKSIEETYYNTNKSIFDGNKKTIINYNEDGKKEKGYPTCYKDEEFTVGTVDDACETVREKEKCKRWKHGCTTTSTTCISD